jgi:hypothetical protein
MSRLARPSFRLAESKSCLTSEDHTDLAIPQGDVRQITLFRRLDHRQMTTLVRTLSCRARTGNARLGSVDHIQVVRNLSKGRIAAVRRRRNGRPAMRK